MSIFDDEIADGLGDIAAEVGREISLQRDVTTVRIVAVPGTTKVLSESMQGARIQVRERDYIIRADLYRFPGDELRQPTPGDLIHDLDATFEVIGLGNTSCWDWSDRGQTHLRVHTRQIGKHC